LETSVDDIASTPIGAGIELSNKSSSSCAAIPIPTEYTGESETDDDSLFFLVLLVGPSPNDPTTENLGRPSMPMLPNLDDGKLREQH
jgi:hypothetical protein